jgi:hypothetical protein
MVNSSLHIHIDGALKFLIDKDQATLLFQKLYWVT